MKRPAKPRRATAFHVLLFVLLAALLLCGCAIVKPKTSGQCGDAVTWAFSEGVLTLTGTGETDRTFLAGGGGYRQPWNRLRKDIQEIHVGEGVTRIGDFAFGACVNLTHVQLPSTLRSIGKSAFYGCAALTNVSLPEGLTEIAAGAFGNCASLCELSLPDGVAHLGQDAFKDTNQRLLTVLGGIQYAPSRDNPYFAAIGILQYEEAYEDALRHCVLHPETRVIADHLFDSAYDIESVSIGENVRHIGHDMVAYVRDLRAIEVAERNSSYCSDGRAVYELSPEDHCAAIVAYAWNSGGTYDIPPSILHNGIHYTVTTIGSFAFSGNERLTQITIPDTIATLEPRAFADCTALNSMTIPGSVATVAYGAFEDCRALKTVVLEEGVREIASSAFINCHALENVFLPASLTSIDNWAFRGADEKPHAGILSILPKGLLRGRIRQIAELISLKGGERTLQYAGTEEQWHKVRVERDPLFDPTFSVYYASN